MIPVFPPPPRDPLGGQAVVPAWMRWFIAMQAAMRTTQEFANLAFILQLPDLALAPNAQALSALVSGYLKNTTGTGVLTTQPVTDGGTHLVSGTDGGLLGFTGPTTLASSVLLTNHALLLGRGAGATPVPLGSLGTATTVLHGAAAGDPTFGLVVLTTDVSGVLPVANGGSGTGTALTAGSVVFAGASGVLSQDNADFFWDNTNKTLLINIPGTGSGLANAFFLQKTQQTNDTGFYLNFRGGAAGTTSRGQIGLTHQGSGGDTIFVGETANDLGLQAANGMQFGIGTAVGLTLTASGLSFVKTIPTYNNIATTGLGVPAIYGYGRPAAGQTAAVTLATYTVGAADGSFLVSANILITTSTAFSFTVTCTYTDEGGTSRTLTLNFSQVTGTFVQTLTNILGAGAYEGVPLHIRAKTATAITIATVGTFTTVAYNGEGQITQLA